MPAWLEEELALRLSQRGRVKVGRCGFGGEVGGRITSLYLLSPHQAAAPTAQKIQLQEACMRKEKSVALLGHQLLEVEVGTRPSRARGLGVQAGGPQPNALSAP